MMEFETNISFDPRVAVAKLAAASYSEEAGAKGQVASALNRAAQNLGWADGTRGPFGKIIPRGAKVLIKPNLVLHENQGPWGMDALVTHPSLVRAAVEGALLAAPSQVVVGDAPIQGCDFDRLLAATELDSWARDLMESDRRFKGVRDFRRTTCVFTNGVRVPTEHLQSADNFILFDLGRDSLLEPITDCRESFRVTCYDPRLLAKTHAPGRHQYLVARDIIEADVVINLPKLKTHKKAGITCALKNLIGINGNKEYLPHHRIGGSETGGDCYPGGSLVKKTLERVADRQNMTSSLAAGRIWHNVATQLDRVARLKGDQLGIEGSWAGNDTIWRTCLDLNRILLYGQPDARMSGRVQRRVIHVVDAVIAGQGDGPLAPQPLPMGLVLAGHNAAAVDWVGAWLLGYDPKRIPIVHEAFGDFQWPLTSFAEDEIALGGDLGTGTPALTLGVKEGVSTIHPVGWREAARR